MIRSALTPALVNWTCEFTIGRWTLRIHRVPENERLRELWPRAFRS